MGDEATLVTGGQGNTATAETKETQTPETKAQTGETKTTETKTEETGTLVTGEGKETQTKETKTEETKETKENKETKTAPETYEDFKLPEGIEPDAEAMASFKALAKEIGLTQEQAQRLIDLQAESLKKQIDGQTKLLKDLGNEWKSQVQKEYGDKLPEELAFVARARDRFAQEHPEAAKELNVMLADSRLGNYPAMVKFFAFAGRMISEDRMEAGKTAPQTMDARTLYPKSDMNP